MNRPRLRRLLVWIGLGVTLPVLVLLIAGLSRAGPLTSIDFAGYWAAGRLNLDGGNPYAPDQLLRLEQQTGWLEAEPIQVWNPPWVLAVVMPFSLAPYSIAKLLWLALSIGVSATCIERCWHLYGGSPGYRALALVAGFTFAPTLVMFKFGQVIPLILLALVGFLHFERQKRWFLAGVLSALALIKPQLLYLFWLALLLWSVKERRWMTLLGVVAATTVATVIAWLPNPAIVAQYLASLGHSSVWTWMPHTLGGLLRLFLGTERLWVQFVPGALGAAWLGAHWQRHNSHWDWTEQMPVLLLVSLATTPYGWLFDEMVLLVPLIQVLAWLHGTGRRAITIGAIFVYAAFNIILLFSTMLPANDPRYPVVYLGWTATAPLLLLGYLLLRTYFGLGQWTNPHRVANSPV